MIISASRRTDIPAFYAEWLMNRIRAGFCTVPNPMNPKQVSRVSLRPEDVDVFVFWTRNPKLLIGRLAELDERGFRYYFQYTILANPRILDPKTPPVNEAVRTFKDLADRIGPDKVIWRYDPILITNQTPEVYHLEKLAAIAASLRGYTKRLVISICDMYKHVEARLRRLKEKGSPIEVSGETSFDELIKPMAGIAAANAMEIFSCAEDLEVLKQGPRPGKCIDDQLIERVFGIRVTHQKDPHQRPACRCVISKDIGAYDSCPFACIYCYATRNVRAAAAHPLRHDPDAPSLSARHEA
jgi:DNA repair photolyase